MVLLIACAGFLAVAANLNPLKPKIKIRLIARICGLILAVVVMVYTGLLLQSIETVAFWASPIVPIIFVVSSFSTGIALLLGVWYLTGNGQKLPILLGRLARFDLVLVFLEVVCIAAFAYFAMSNSEIYSAALELAMGESAAIFWLGFVLCGLILPVFAQNILAKNTAEIIPNIAGIMSLAVLVGGFSLRWCVILAGAQPVAQTLNAAWGL
ncbi:hypothetical protein FACS1894104_0300 [Actinomycetota bacterium]|nr:hypothetical protein FACS1894104_0300 [Actinomycetota bacterium]